MQAPACSNNPCGENAACAAAANATGYTCSCKEGFALDGGKCVDTDECFEGTHTCHMTAKCENTPGSFDCTCPLGYSGGTPAGFACAPRISAGSGHACAVLADGTVRCWGKNDLGQLGDGTQTDSTNPVSVKGLNNAAVINAGDKSTCALLQDGTMQCWGDNSAGQLGSGTMLNQLAPTPVARLDSIVAMDMGATMCALPKAMAR